MLADFVFQTQDVCKGKEKSWRVMLAHGLGVLVVHACVLMPFLFDQGRSILVAIAIALTHVAIDALKVRVERKPGIKLRWFLLDQMLHGAVLVGCAYVWVESSISFHFDPVLPLAPEDVVRCALIVAAYAFAGNGGSAIVASVLARLRRDNDSASSDMERPGARGAGKLIGVLERLILVTLVWQGEWGAIGFVLAAKSVARFKEMDESSSFAEVYLVGTLTSFLVAGSLGLLLRNVG